MCNSDHDIDFVDILRVYKIFVVLLMSFTFIDLAWSKTYEKGKSNTLFNLKAQLLEYDSCLTLLIGDRYMLLWPL